MYRASGLSENPSQYSVAVSMFDQHGDGKGTEFTVECHDFCKFAEALDCDADLVKIDIEGAEVALLNSPVKERIKHIFVETHYNLFPEQIAPIAWLRRQFSGRTGRNVNFDWP
ncbi:MAG: FkbM family methyltransferase [Tateyamaria sp.]|uniref:FkbM family methyltransferase n=1 Tax=Tateyamaria sp. TaxID=1929288 RepID=UPI0032900A04